MSPTKTQKNYTLPPFVRSRYEQLGTKPKEQTFEPLQIKVIKAGVEAVIDPMFADYGGRIIGDSKDIRIDNQNIQRESLGAEGGNSKESTSNINADEIAKLLAEEYERGFSDGTQASNEALEIGLQELRERVSSFCEQLGSKVNSEQKRVEKQAIGLAMLIARRIIGEAVEINPEYLLPILREALGYVGGAEIHRVRISSADLEFVEIEKIREQFDGNWTFVGDPLVESGCIIDTSSGEVDYRLDAAWQRLKDSVIKGISG